MEREEREGGEKWGKGNRESRKGGKGDGRQKK